ncbi:Hpt domain-containing protein [Flavobacteriaceae bacterium S356]|uniref:Hpt domain-containing protein n=1 Tax=Asprobacillus argus TaxID=3076534 RepID=A0ABU3LBR4_9FLAO|nr:Hpt domain-containing protein [Flavobacteriaceae bacterium S356]
MDTPNLNYIKELSGGDKQFETKVLSILTEEFPNELDRFLSNYKKKDYKKSAEDVHKLKHKISILGLVNGYHVAVAFENELKLESDSLFGSFMEVMEQIKLFLKKVNPS